jgi:hypothetical protein
VATCCWITANVVWMVGEFYFDDRTVDGRQDPADSVQPGAAG